MANESETATQGIRSPWSTLVRGLGVLAVYFLSGKFGLSLAFMNASASPIWPPTGIALAVILLWGSRFALPIFVGAFLVNITTQGSVGTSLAIAAGNTLEALVGAWLVGHFGGGPNSFGTPRRILAYVALAALLSTTVSPSFGVTSLCSAGFTAWNQYGASWLTWWLGDVVSNLTIAPLILIWATEPVPRQSRDQLFEAALLAASILVLNAFIFPLFPLRDKNIPIGYLAILPLLWAAFRFGKLGAITSAIVTSGFALYGTLHGVGPYIKPDMNESLILMQAFIATATLTALLVSAVVTEHKRGEITRARLSSIVEWSDDAIISKDLNGNIVTWNNAAEHIFGFRPEEIIGQHISRILPAQLHEQEEQILSRLRRGESIRHYETLRVSKDGDAIPVSLTISPLKDSTGNVVGSCSISRDVTERKRAEHALEKAKTDLENHAKDLEKIVAERTSQLREINTELEAFSFSLSHDLRAPLRAMRNFTQIVLEDHRQDLGADAATLERVVAAAKRLDRMIRDVLALSRISRQDLSLRAVDVENLLLTIINERPEFQAPRADIQISTPLPNICGDETSLNQCIANLLDNAVKFMPVGTQPRVIIEGEVVGERVRLLFQDNGIGIDGASQQKIFEVFKRGPGGSQYEGSGLGLAIVRKAVERMGGTVGVESEPGKGSRFWLELPKA